jgi:lipoprotein-releasing system permease protein
MRGKRSANAVPVLARISMIAIAVSSAAMIVIFSVFNGLEGMVKDLYKGFYPDVKITVNKGRFFPLTAQQLAAVAKMPGVERFATVIEGNAIVNNPNINEQKVIMLKGIDNSYLLVNDIRASITGDDTVSSGELPTAIGGVKILNSLGVDINNVFSRFDIYYANPESALITDNPESITVHPAGAFRISDDFDDQYILAPLQLVQKLFHQTNKYTSLEIKIAPGADENKVVKNLENFFGSNYTVATRYQQNKTMYMVMRSEKWAIYAIWVMVLLVASVNMIGALSMLVLEKQKDMAILKTMGVQSQTVRAIFLLEGILWALTGGIIGLGLGSIICVLQQQFGIISVGGSFLMDAYPVAMSATDFLLVLLTVATVGALGAWFPASKAMRIDVPSLRSQ